ncbi:MAG: hypothetical protein WC222_04150 [Parachlamydiales bacterium]|jgi:serine/threonine protein kinase
MSLNSLKKSHNQNKKVQKEAGVSDKSALNQLELENIQVSFRQKLYPSGSLYQVCDQKVLPNGDVLTEKMHTQLLIDCLKALQPLHVLGIVHGNLRSGNIKVKFSKHLGRYTIKIPDINIAGPSDTSSDIYALGCAFGYNENDNIKTPTHTKAWGLRKMAHPQQQYRFHTAQEAREYFEDLSSS